MRLETQTLSSGQEARENMLDVVSLQGNANPKHSETPLVTQEDGQNEEDKQ